MGPKKETGPGLGVEKRGSPPKSSYKKTLSAVQCPIRSLRIEDVGV